MNHQPKISKITALFLLLFTIIIDILGFLIVEDFFILDILSLPTLFYFKIKKIDSFNDKIFTGLEFVPILGALPLKTLGVLLVILEDRNPNSRLVRIARNTVGKLNPKKMFSSGGKG